jgi:hypothetical protein
VSEGLIEAARRLSTLLEALAAIIGGLAINARVRVRATRDVDALIAIVPGDVVRLVQLARELLGMTLEQQNVLLRLVLRSVDRSLTHSECNELRDRVYAALHEGR